MESEYDVVIVGAGSAGCALATRLTEDSSRRVLLLDAGPYFRTQEEYPTELLMTNSFGAMVPGNPCNWSFVGRLTPDRVYPMPRGKVVGGSSAVNGTVFFRPLKQDFDIWAEQGNQEWKYEAVLPYYLKTERDLDFPDDPNHGSSGLMPVRRAPREELHPLSAAFEQSCLELGYSAEVDKNAPGEPGVGLIPHNCVDGIRMNCALTYLASCADRENLTIRGDTYARRILFDGTRATGVEVARQGRVEQIHAAEIVISAGTLKSPQLLMVSGVGPADELAKHGIPVVRISEGVGRNIVDHPMVALGYTIEDMDLGASAPLSASPLEMSLNYSSSVSGGSHDLQIMVYAEPVNRALLGSAPGAGRFRLPPYLRHPFATLNSLRRLPLKYVLNQALAGRNLLMMCSLEQPTSRGRITLASPDPADAPEIMLDYLSDESDRSRMRQMVRDAARILDAPSYRKIGAKRLSPTDADLASDDALDAWVRDNLATSFHTSCSLRMGPETDPMAVVDQYCKVHGTSGLRVIDLSIAPAMVRRAPYATAIMIGERASAFFD